MHPNLQLQEMNSPAILNGSNRSLLNATIDRGNRPERANLKGGKFHCRQPVLSDRYKFQQPLRGGEGRISLFPRGVHTV